MKNTKKILHLIILINISIILTFNVIFILPSLLYDDYFGVIAGFGSIMSQFSDAGMLLLLVFLGILILVPLFLYSIMSFIKTND